MEFLGDVVRETHLYWVRRAANVHGKSQVKVTPSISMRASPYRHTMLDNGENCVKLHNKLLLIAEICHGDFHPEIDTRVTLRTF